MLTPGPLAQLKEAQEYMNPQQSRTQQITSQQQQAASQQCGASNDRIVWKMPNFLTLEDAESVPRLTAGQKFKVAAREAFDPMELVLGNGLEFPDAPLQFLGDLIGILLSGKTHRLSDRDLHMSWVRQDAIFLP